MSAAELDASLAEGGADDGAVGTGGPAAVKTKRPSSSKFKQQQLSAWQPMLTAGTVLPAFFVIGVAFIPIGIALLTFSSNVHEQVFDYTYCNSSAEPSRSCDELLRVAAEAGTTGSTCRCQLSFNVTSPVPGDVYMYYGLTNYYQNHRRYVKSRDDSQLLGDTDASLSDCAPFDRLDGHRVAPCGAIANSLFNDSYKLTLTASPGAVPQTVPLLRTGIAWPSDKQKKFQNPPGALSDAGAFRDTVAPLNWPRPVWKLDPDHPDNNGYENEDLIVWMRTAALPTFRKLWARLDHEPTRFGNGLPNGTYLLDIDYRYPVSAFGGTKRFIISNTSLLGGKNPFLGVAYIVVGCVCLVLGVVFLFVHIKYGKRGPDTITNHTPWAGH